MSGIPDKPKPLSSTSKKQQEELDKSAKEGMSNYGEYKKGIDKVSKKREGGKSSPNSDRTYSMESMYSRFPTTSSSTELTGDNLPRYQSLPTTPVGNDMIYYNPADGMTYPFPDDNFHQRQDNLSAMAAKPLSEAERWLNYYYNTDGPALYVAKDPGLKDFVTPHGERGLKKEEPDGRYSYIYLDSVYVMPDGKTPAPSAQDYDYRKNRWNTLIKDSEIGDDTKKETIGSVEDYLTGYKKLTPDIVRLLVQQNLAAIGGDNGIYPYGIGDDGQARLSSIPIANIQRDPRDADLKYGRPNYPPIITPYRSAAGVESTFFGADSQIPSFAGRTGQINIGSMDVLGVPVSTPFNYTYYNAYNKPQDVGFWKQLAQGAADPFNQIGTALINATSGSSAPITQTTTTNNINAGLPYTIGNTASTIGATLLTGGESLIGQSLANAAIAAPSLYNQVNQGSMSPTDAAIHTAAAGALPAVGSVAGVGVSKLLPKAASPAVTSGNTFLKSMQLPQRSSQAFSNALAFPASGAAVNAAANTLTGNKTTAENMGNQALFDAALGTALGFLHAPKPAQSPQQPAPTKANQNAQATLPSVGTTTWTNYIPPSLGESTPEVRFPKLAASPSDVRPPSLAGQHKVAETPRLAGVEYTALPPAEITTPPQQLKGRDPMLPPASTEALSDAAAAAKAQEPNPLANVSTEPIPQAERIAKVTAELQKRQAANINTPRQNEMLDAIINADAAAKAEIAKNAADRAAAIDNIAKQYDNKIAATLDPDEIMKLSTDKEAEIKLYQTSEDTPVPGFTPSNTAATNLTTIISTVPSTFRSVDAIKADFSKLAKSQGIAPSQVEAFKNMLHQELKIASAEQAADIAYNKKIARRDKASKRKTKQDETAVVTPTESTPLESAPPQNVSPQGESPKAPTEAGIVRDISNLLNDTSTTPTNVNARLQVLNSELQQARRQSASNNANAASGVTVTPPAGKTPTAPPANANTSTDIPPFQKGLPLTGYGESVNMGKAGNVLSVVSGDGISTAKNNVLDYVLINGFDIPFGEGIANSPFNVNSDTRGSAGRGTGKSLRSYSQSLTILGLPEKSSTKTPVGSINKSKTDNTYVATITPEAVKQMAIERAIEDVNELRPHITTDEATSAGEYTDPNRLEETLAGGVVGADITADVDNRGQFADIMDALSQTSENARNTDVGKTIGSITATDVINYVNAANATARSPHLEVIKGADGEVTHIKTTAARLKRADITSVDTPSRRATPSIPKYMSSLPIVDVSNIVKDVNAANKKSGKNNSGDKSAIHDTDTADDGGETPAKGKLSWKRGDVEDDINNAMNQDTQHGVLVGNPDGIKRIYDSPLASYDPKTYGKLNVVELQPFNIARNAMSDPTWSGAGSVNSTPENSTQHFIQANAIISMANAIHDVTGISIFNTRQVAKANEYLNTHTQVSRSNNTQSTSIPTSTGQYNNNDTKVKVEVKAPPTKSESSSNTNKKPSTTDKTATDDITPAKGNNEAPNAKHDANTTITSAATQGTTGVDANYQKFIAARQDITAVGNASGRTQEANNAILKLAMLSEAVSKAEKGAEHNTDELLTQSRQVTSDIIEVFGDTPNINKIAKGPIGEALKSIASRISQLQKKKNDAVNRVAKKQTQEAADNTDTNAHSALQTKAADITPALIQNSGDTKLSALSLAYADIMDSTGNYILQNAGAARPQSTSSPELDAAYNNLVKTNGKAFADEMLARVKRDYLIGSILNIVDPNTGSNINKKATTTERQDALRLINIIEAKPSLFADAIISKSPDIHANFEGQYYSAGELVVIAPISSKGTTLAHELVGHHLERYLPEPVRDKIRASWENNVKQWAKNKGTDEAQDIANKLIESEAPDAHDIITDEAFYNKTVDNNMPYELWSPSEYWAENATEMMFNRFNELQKGIIYSTYRKLKRLFTATYNKIRNKNSPAAQRAKTLMDAADHLLRKAKKTDNNAKDPLITNRLGRTYSRKKPQGSKNLQRAKLKPDVEKKRNVGIPSNRLTFKGTNIVAMTNPVVKSIINYGRNARARITPLLNTASDNIMHVLENATDTQKKAIIETNTKIYDTLDKELNSTAGRISNSTQRTATITKVTNAELAKLTPETRKLYDTWRQGVDAYNAIHDTDNILSAIGVPKDRLHDFCLRMKNKADSIQNEITDTKNELSNTTNASDAKTLQTKIADLTTIKAAYTNLAGVEGRINTLAKSNAEIHKFNPWPIIKATAAFHDGTKKYTAFLTFGDTRVRMYADNSAELGKILATEIRKYKLKLKDDKGNVTQTNGTAQSAENNQLGDKFTLVDDKGNEWTYGVMDTTDDIQMPAIAAARELIIGSISGSGTSEALSQLSETLNRSSNIPQNLKDAISNMTTPHGALDLESAQNAIAMINSDMLDNALSKSTTLSSEANRDTRTMIEGMVKLINDSKANTAMTTRAQGVAYELQRAAEIGINDKLNNYLRNWNKIFTQTNNNDKTTAQAQRTANKITSIFQMMVLAFNTKSAIKNTLRGVLTGVTNTDLHTMLTGKLNNDPTYKKAYATLGSSVKKELQARQNSREALHGGVEAYKEFEKVAGLFISKSQDVADEATAMLAMHTYLDGLTPTQLNDISSGNNAAVRKATNNISATIDYSQGSFNADELSPIQQWVHNNIPGGRLVTKWAAPRANEIGMFTDLVQKALKKDTNTTAKRKLVKYVVASTAVLGIRSLPFIGTTITALNALNGDDKRSEIVLDKMKRDLIDEANKYDMGNYMNEALNMLDRGILANSFTNLDISDQDQMQTLINVFPYAYLTRIYDETNKQLGSQTRSSTEKLLEVAGAILPAAKQVVTALELVNVPGKTPNKLEAALKAIGAPIADDTKDNERFGRMNFMTPKGRKESATKLINDLLGSTEVFIDDIPINQEGTSEDDIQNKQKAIDILLANNNVENVFDDATNIVHTLDLDKVKNAVIDWMKNTKLGDIIPIDPDTQESISNVLDNSGLSPDDTVIDALNKVISNDDNPNRDAANNWINKNVNAKDSDKLGEYTLYGLGWKFALAQAFNDSDTGITANFTPNPKSIIDDEPNAELDDIQLTLYGYIAGKAIRTISKNAYKLPGE